MEEIKERTALIEKFIQSNSTFGKELYDYELISLHLRKILELIALSSLVANKALYLATHKKLVQWSTKRLVEHLEKINPDFYPVPMKIVLLGTIGENNHWQIEKLENGFLTKEDFEKLYGLCCDVLHVWSPYDERDRKINFEIHLSQWLEKIKSLLNMHYIQLVEGDVWLIRMANDKNKVQAQIAIPVVDSDIPTEMKNKKI
jgi:hypothetical protein